MERNFFNENGELSQVLYATVASHGPPAIGIIAKDGIVLATQRNNNVLEIPKPKIEKVTHGIAITYSGLDADFRMILQAIRKIVNDYHYNYSEQMSVLEVAQEISAYMHERTFGYERPFGTMILIAGYFNGPHIYQVDPSGNLTEHRAVVVGKENGIFLPNQIMTIDDTISFLNGNMNFSVGILKNGKDLELL